MSSLIAVLQRRPWPAFAGSMLAGLALVLLLLSPHFSNKAGAQPLDETWRALEQTTFAVVMCEGPDKIPGNADDRPKNNPSASGTATLSYDEASQAWRVAGTLTDLRAGDYRLTIGRLATGERTTLLEFTTVDDPVAPDDHIDWNFEISGLTVLSTGQYDVLEVERRGPPWGGGGACTGDHAGMGGGGCSGEEAQVEEDPAAGGPGGAGGCAGEDAEEGETCPGEEGGAASGEEPGGCAGEEGETCPGDVGVAPGEEPGGCSGEDGEVCPGEDGEEGGPAGDGHEGGESGGCGGCGGGGGAGTQWRAELQARFSLSEYATYTVRQEALATGVDPLPADPRYTNVLVCSGDGIPVEWIMGVGEVRTIVLRRGSVCSLSQRPVDDGSVVAGLFSDEVVNFDRSVSVINYYTGALPAAPQALGVHVHETLDVAAAETLVWANGARSFFLDLPEGAVSGSPRIHLGVDEGSATQLLGETVAPPEGNVEPVGVRVFSITLQDADTDATLALHDYVTFAVRLDPAELDGRAVLFMRWDEGRARWMDLPTRVFGDIVSFDTDGLGRFRLFEVPVRSVSLEPGWNTLVFTGPDGTPGLDLASQLHVAEGDVMHAPAGGAPAFACSEARLSKGEAVLVRVAEPTTTSLPARIDGTVTMRTIALEPGLTALGISSPVPVPVDAILASSSQRAVVIQYFDRAINRWRLATPAGPASLSESFLVEPFGVLWVSAPLPTTLVVPDALLGRTR